MGLGRGLGEIQNVVVGGGVIALEISIAGVYRCCFSLTNFVSEISCLCSKWSD